MRFYQTVKSFFKNYRGPLFSGVLIGLAFIPFPFVTWFFALVPFWYFLYLQKSLKKVLVGAFVTQCVSTFVGFNWVMFTAHTYGQLNLFNSFLILLFFCSFANIFIVISSWVWFVLSQKTKISQVKLLLFPVLFSLFHSLIPMIFPWDMGYPWLWSGFWGAQTAELWGFRFLNTLFYVFNLLFLIVFYHTQRKNISSKSSYFKRLKAWLFSFHLDRVGKQALLFSLLLFVFLNALGFFLKQRLPEPDGTLKVLLVQNNINALSLKDHPNPRAKTLSVLRDLSYEGLKKVYRKNKKHSPEKKKLSDMVDLIVWSEGSFPYPIKKRQKRNHRMKRIIQYINIPIVTGGIHLYPKQRVKNSVFVFDRKGRIVKPIHSKTKLLIFGEYFPLIDRFPVMRKLFPYFGVSQLAGEKLEPTLLDGVSYAWQICYEVLFDKLVREFARKKSQVLINVSNDSWYGYPQQPYQHLTMSFARAVEVRQPMLRVTNTGFSGVIFANADIPKDPLTNIPKLSPLNQAWFGYYEVPYYKKPLQTLFMGWGYYINELFLLIGTLWIGLKILFLKKS